MGRPDIHPRPRRRQVRRVLRPVPWAQLASQITQACTRGAGGDQVVSNVQVSQVLFDNAAHELSRAWKKISFAWGGGL